MFLKKNSRTHTVSLLTTCLGLAILSACTIVIFCCYLYAISLPEYAIDTIIYLQAVSVFLIYAGTVYWFGNYTIPALVSFASYNQFYIIFEINKFWLMVWAHPFSHFIVLGIILFLIIPAWFLKGSYWQYYVGTLSGIVLVEFFLIIFEKF